MVPAALAACMVVAVVGCNSNKKNTQVAASAAGVPPVNQAVLNIPAAPPATYTPPAAQQPVVFDPPAAAPVAQPAAAVADASDTVATAAPAPAPRVRSAPARRSSAGSSGAIASATSGSKYTIKKGDSLWSIAQSKYGNGNKWKAIAKANPKLDPNHVTA